MPNGDQDFPNHWRLIKARFSKSLPKHEPVTPSRVKKGERGIWQRRYWEHLIRDQRDFNNHMDYIHFNPIKHRHVERVQDWPYSSFHRYVKNGLYTKDWTAGDEAKTLDLE